MKGFGSFAICTTCGKRLLPDQAHVCEFGRKIASPNDMMRYLLPDDPEPGCGYGWVKSSPDDPLRRACDVHDQRYGQHDSGDEFEPYTQERADKEFLANALRIAQTADSTSMKLRAYVFYGIVRSFGWLLW